MAQKTTKIEFGDFQTPPILAGNICRLLHQKIAPPASIIEPSCGTGAFLVAALKQFPKAKKISGFEINSQYIDRARQTLKNTSVNVEHADFFKTRWDDQILKNMPDPLLIIGNPPWVTNATLGALNSSNLPEKSNFLGLNGLDALTGKSNFDISEWMLLRHLHWINGRKATFAMLCKTTVARKVLMYGWKKHIGIGRASIYLIDAAKYFGAAVDACLLVCSSIPGKRIFDCPIYDALDAEKPTHTIGYRDGKMVAKADLYNRYKYLQGESSCKWRSGLKHDCSKIMEFQKEGNRYRNGLGELIDLEDDYLYPMLKSSDIANDRVKAPKRWVLVTQKNIGEETDIIQNNAPKTWEYLQSHSKHLDQRRSAIYKNKPRYSMFAVGPYTFSPWKVAISGFYKRLNFKTLSSVDNKPIVLDDTCYFLPCSTKRTAVSITDMLNSEIAQNFFNAFIFWDSKRPITVDILRRLNIEALAIECGIKLDKMKTGEQGKFPF